LDDRAFYQEVPGESELGWISEACLLGERGDDRAELFDRGGAGLPNRVLAVAYLKEEATGIDRPRSAEVKRAPDAAMPGGEVLPLLGADVGDVLPLLGADVGDVSADAHGCS
jgi:hypothetical protein